jgi:hypothetical protein
MGTIQPPTLSPITALQENFFEVEPKRLQSQN